MDRTVLITGAGGRIGRILRKHWLGRHRIVGVDAAPYRSDENTEVQRHCDIGHDIEALGKAFADAGRGAVVVHLAAVTWETVGWDEILHTNIMGTQNVFRVAHEHGARKAIFASSNHVTGGYGDWPPGTDPQSPFVPPPTISPTSPIRPDSLYGVSKACGEAFAYFASTAWLLDAICLRIGSVTKTDDPLENTRLRSTWLSHRDCCHLFDCAVNANARFGIYYGVSNNTQKFWDIENARRELGYQPQDNAEEHYAEASKGQKHAHTA